MRPREATWIAQQLKGVQGPLLNIGSSTATFRTQRQPHIDREVFAPLRRQGVEVIHLDLKAALGVDIAGDLADPSTQSEIMRRAPRAGLCSNLLEHVVDPAGFAQVIQRLFQAGAVLIVTVPHSYPYHADPIDTGFRPTPDQLAALFPACRVRAAEVLVDDTYGRELLRGGKAGAVAGVRTLIGALRPTEVGRAQRDRLRWLFRPFTTSAVVLEVVS